MAESVRNEHGAEKAEIGRPITHGLADALGGLIADQLRSIEERHQETLRQLDEATSQLDAAKVANTAVWVAAERASRKGYELDPDDVLDMLKEDQ